MGAAHRSAARAWGARPVPFRTRKLSPIAPRVLRGQPVGGQGAADRWTAPSRTLELRRGRPRGLLLFCVYGLLSHIVAVFYNPRLSHLLRTGYNNLVCAIWR